ncbi:hypothetical protein AB5J62_22785 [Amycolatopsis sp. cg5]|uniref:hypothetical protein n=1 Tax=Amycolatopsis sp. cg5 TaxID=3238802 RepID=UPI003523AD24
MSRSIAVLAAGALLAAAITTAAPNTSFASGPTRTFEGFGSGTTELSASQAAKNDAYHWVAYYNYSGPCTLVSEKIERKGFGSYTALLKFSCEKYPW